MKYSGISVFSDFDGTIINRDLGDEVFKHFAVFEPYNSMLKAGEIKIKEYWQTLCRHLPNEINEEKIKLFALECAEIDSNFKSFVEYCQISGFDFTVVSDGFSVYIDAILKKAGVDVKYYSNKLIFKENSIEPYFPGATESCTCLCASCKRNSVITNCPPDNIIVFIGDGYSDFCAAEHSDIVFAKGNLAAYCNKNRIPHYPFTNFFDVKRILSNAIQNNKIRPRHQAYLKRKEAFETE